MRLGYNTNSLAHHDLFQAVELVAETGFRSVALTLDHGSANPFAADWPVHRDRLRKLLAKLKLSTVIETGARFLLDPRVKHEPTLIAADPARRAQRNDFLCRAIDAAAALESDCVSLWSGCARDSAPMKELWSRLLDGLRQVLDHAERRGVTIGFEPEPGMFIDTMDQFAELVRLCPSPRLKLTLDVGHLHCLGEVPIADQIARWSSLLVNVHIEDMRRGIHEHLMFGDGEMDFPPIIEALARAGYTGGIHVELSRHSHAAPTALRKSFDFLHPLVSRYAAG